MKRRRLEQIFLEHQHLIEKAVYSQNIQVTGVTADDVYQEVSIKLFKLLESDREIENLSSYIYRTAANVIIDLARKQQKHEQNVALPEDQDEQGAYRTDLVSPVAEPDRLLADKQLQQQIMAAIADLPESRRVAVKLRLQGYAVKEMAELTGWSFYKAENLSKRGILALKEKLKELDIDYDFE